MGSEVHSFASADGRHILVVDGSRIYDLPSGVEDARGWAARAGLLDGRRYVTSEPLAPPPLRALSLNVAQGCNMSCGYCYADEGRFGGQARLMDAAVARAAVERLLSEIAPGADAVLGFMGGEPFLNRRLIHEITPWAAATARARGVRLRFSVTTNATLLTDADAALLAEHRFTVAVSLDGARTENDRHRRLRRGGGAYDRAVAGLARLLEGPARPRHISVRATVTPRGAALPDLLDHLLSLGVDEAGFAPVLVAPNPADAFTEADFDRLLDGMIACGAACKQAILARRRLPFGNFETAMHEIARGSHRPYPCGAAAGYASVSAEGNLFACHRAIDDPAFAIGSLRDGPDRARRASFLAGRHVLNQQPCAGCWARFLCGGGCHHEVIARGRPGCDYIRGWLDFCLGAYVELATAAPGYFRDSGAYFDAAKEDALCRTN